MRLFNTTFALALVATSALTVTQAAAFDQSVRTTDAANYEADIVPAQNDYLKSSEGGGILAYNGPDQSLVSKTVCGAFVARVYKNAYSTELSQPVMQGLFGGPNDDPNQGLPDASHWYQAIEGNGNADWTYSTATQTFSMGKAAVYLDATNTPRLRLVTGNQEMPFQGAVIAAKYTGTGGDTGHAMLADTARVVANPANAPSGTVVTVQVRIWDSTKTVHSAPAGAPEGDLDTRIGDDENGAYDKGAGAGSIRLFLGAATGTGSRSIVGWSWSVTDNGDVYTNAAGSRPITVGFLRF